MLIAHVTFSIAEEDRFEALAILKKEIVSVCKMKGCVTFLPFISLNNKAEIGVIHEWESEEEFSAYLESESFKTIGQLLRPMMTTSPLSKRYNANLIQN